MHSPTVVKTSIPPCVILSFRPPKRMNARQGRATLAHVPAAADRPKSGTRVAFVCAVPDAARWPRGPGPPGGGHARRPGRPREGNGRRTLFDNGRRRRGDLVRFQRSLIARGPAKPATGAGPFRAATRLPVRSPCGREVRRPVRSSRRSTRSAPFLACVFLFRPLRSAITNRTRWRTSPLFRAGGAVRGTKRAFLFPP